MVPSTWQVSADGGVTWVDIPVPSSWTWSYYDLSSDDSGRSLDGMMHKDLAGGVKRKHELVWQNKDPSVAKTIMNAAKSAIFVKFKAYDLFDGAIKIITAYTGDITATATGAYGGPVYEVKVNFIEQ